MAALIFMLCLCKMKVDLLSGLSIVIMTEQISLYSVEQIRQIEEFYKKKQGVGEESLMSLSALALYKRIRLSYPSAKNLLIVVGKGNNGGDGIFLAKHAVQSGLNVQILLAVDENCVESNLKNMLHDLQSVGVIVEEFYPGIQVEADLIIDALLGIGLKGSLRPHYVKVIQWINKHPSPCLAVDVPSGLDADTGTAEGECVRAEITQSFIARKRGLYTCRSAEFRGQVFLDSLGVDVHAMPIASKVSLLSDVNASWLPRRNRDAHKGDFGHVLVIGGDYGMGGAIRMAAEAALRAGAGLVTVATRPEHICVVNACRPEIMCQKVEAVSSIEGLQDKVDVVIIGPGLGMEEWGESLFDAIVEWPQPKVLDADALNWLVKKPTSQSNWVLTPHPGEAARLLASSGDYVQSDRFHAVDAIQKRYGGVVALKGSGTLVASHEQIYLCPLGNPGMATGGMGDILAGMIGGLMAQGLSSFQAASMGVLIHAMASDQAAQIEGERGMLALDVLSYMKDFINPDQAVLA